MSIHDPLTNTEVKVKFPHLVKFTRDEAAELLSTSVRQIDRWIADGDLKAVKAGRAVRIPYTSILEFGTEIKAAG